MIKRAYLIRSVAMAKCSLSEDLSVSARPIILQHFYIAEVTNQGKYVSIIGRLRYTLMSTGKASNCKNYSYSPRNHLTVQIDGTVILNYSDKLLYCTVYKVKLPSNNFFI